MPVSVSIFNTCEFQTYIMVNPVGGEGSPTHFMPAAASDWSPQAAEGPSYADQPSHDVLGPGQNNVWFVQQSTGMDCEFEITLPAISDSLQMYFFVTTTGDDMTAQMVVMDGGRYVASATGNPPP